jgi:AcrR family transcriptional regulator
MLVKMHTVAYSNSSNKHQQKTEETRRKLLRSARKVFARDGFEAARLEDIAKEAGHTRGAFYAHFESKEDLFFALLEQQAFEHHRQIQRLLSPISGQEEKLRVLREYYVTKAGDRSWSMLMLEFKLFAARHPKIRPKLAKTHRTIRQTIRQEIESLLPSNVRINSRRDSAIRTVLEALLHGLTLELAYDPSVLKREEAERVLRRVFNLLISTQEDTEAGDSTWPISLCGEMRLPLEFPAPEPQ